ncbi:Hypothetical predicted protein [Paramuricea clavata]|uniref:Uncharacterized protein n=1 Tax=Paramuricea clavata TaxID=317549 RepID=A0A6S7G1V4_PARCT|nr:Hypothetical predicted protein [Paramuricea clavata]
MNVILCWVMYAALYRGQRLIKTVCLYQNLVVSLFTGINICPTREITASSGKITSPNYPNKYPPNTDCTLTIEQPLDTKFVFNLTNIDLGGKAYASKCDDSLTITGRTSSKLCGPRSRLREYDLNIITLRFQSNGTVARTGFELTFTTVRTLGLPKPISVCPSRVIKPDAVGRISSPGYPKDNYGNKLNCKLVLKVPLFKELELITEYADIPGASYPCRNNSLKILAGYSFSSMCGLSDSPSRPRTYDDGEVRVIFTNDGIAHGKGFMISYRLLDQYRRRCTEVNGLQYLKRKIKITDVLNFQRANDDISLQFRTRYSNGLLLYAKEGNKSILLILSNRTMVFEVMYGTDHLILTAPSQRLDDNKWHTVVVQRRGLNFSINVDRNSPATGQIATKLPQLPSNPRRVTMYMFGGPSRKWNPFPINFEGYVLMMKINEMQPIASYDLRDPKYQLRGGRNRLPIYRYCYTS